jgi:hypothetical protein
MMTHPDFLGVGRLGGGRCAESRASPIGTAPGSQLVLDIPVRSNELDEKKIQVVAKAT